MEDTEIITASAMNVKIEENKKNARPYLALLKGDGGIRTRDGGFADLCLNHLATSP